MKNKNTSKFFLKSGIAVVICIFLIATSFSSATMLYSASQTRSITNENQSIDGDSSEMLGYKFDFTEPELQQTTLQGTRYTRAVVRGCLNIGAIGEPSLPVKPVRLAVPMGMEVKDITVTGDAIEIDTAAKRVNLQNFTIIPEQPQVSFGKFDSTEIVIDQEAYTSTERCPCDPYYDVGVGDYCGYRILTVQLFPVQYISASGKLFYYPTLTITVETEQIDHVSPFYRGSSIDKAKVREFVDNPEVIDTYDHAIRGETFYSNGLCNPSESYDYILITNNALNNTVGQDYNWSDLLDHRQTYSGLNTTKITVETIDSCPAYWNETDLFNDSAAHIREFIKDAYQNWGTQYVLLGGDWDNSGRIVPSRNFTVSEMAFDDYGTMPCDLYYSNLNGTWWDTEHDLWGGGKASNANDPFAEVFVGRLTVDNASQISNIVKKIIWYDLYENIDFLNRSVFFGGDLGDEFHVTSADYMEEVRNGNDPHFYECKGFAEWNEEHLNPLLQFDISERRYFDWGYSIPDAYKSLINNNDACVINHLSHGTPTHALDMEIDELQSLTNSKYFFAYSQGCLCGRFTEGDTTEKILICDSADNGAFAVVFNTGYGYGTRWSTNGSSQFLQRYFWDYMFDIKADDMAQWMIGDAHYYSKDQISAYIDNEDWYRAWVYVFYSAHLFGDPAQAIRLTFPGDNVGVLALDVGASDHVKPDKAIYVNATLINNGQYDETDVVVSLRVNGLEVNSTTIPFFERSTIQHVSFIWNPGVGEYNVTINVTIPGVLEDSYADNERSHIVIVGVQNINTHECFETIQEAVDALNTSDGHTILAPSDIYSENVMIYKGISLIGMNRDSTIIEGIGSAPSVIHVLDTSFVTITGFTLRNGTVGVYVESSSHTTIPYNNIVNNHEGIVIDVDSNNSLIYLNYFNNTQNAFDAGSDNQWDNGYLDGFSPCGGNWWSEYTGVDEFSGLCQDEPGPDGIGDTPYNISGGISQDRYPFMQLYDPLYPVNNLDTGKVFMRIQDAIDDPDTLDGHTIFIRRNNYYEHLIVNKTLTLTGIDKNSAIIDGNASGDVISILANRVNISSFTIRNSGSGAQKAGVKLLSDYNAISDCIVRNNTNGIKLVGSAYNNITGNTITNNTYGIELKTMYSIPYVISSENNIIFGNTITSNDWGILFGPGSKNNIISNNNILDNGLGIKIYEMWGFLGQSTDNQIYHNNFNNTQNAFDDLDNENEWYNDTLDEGNYWSDYTEQCLNPIDSQPPYGIWDVPYNISGRTPPNQDMYPFRFPNGWEMIPCDLDGDGDVGLSDLAQLLGNYGMTNGATYEDGDINGDGDVDLIDLVILLANYGYGTGPIPGDTDLDGDVDLVDLAQFLGYYGMTSGATWEMGDFDGDGDVDLSDLAALLANYGYTHP